jgi:ribosomal protein L11 methyltransferase
MYNQSGMSWLQLSVVTNKANAETVADTLDALGAVSVTLQDAADEALLEPAPGEHPVWQNVQVTALFPPGSDAGQLSDGVREALQDPALHITIGFIEDQDWSETWRRDFHAMQFGSRLWVCPAHESPPDPSAVVVDMDPGLAFGTGTHATTAMCLDWLDGHPPEGLRVIDYGCGSGILAIAACKLGASHVTAVDIDPQAIQATQENARRNAVSLQAALPGELDAAPADLLMANILANPLIQLAGALKGLVKPGGCIVMTGILAEQVEAVMAAYRGSFVFDKPAERDEWVLLVGRRLRGNM